MAGCRLIMASNTGRVNASKIAAGRGRGISPELQLVNEAAVAGVHARPLPTCHRPRADGPRRC